MVFGKATEVGVTAVVPLETEHSERRVFKPERGEKVVTAALKQSLKAYRPVLHPLTPSAKRCCRPRGAEVHRPLRPGAVARREGLPGRALRPGETATVFIGPEGDFSPGEIAFALANGFEEITLDDSVCAPRPRPSRRWSWHRWSTVKNTINF